jgi:type II secretory pathway pseudopilin PulG
MLVVTVIMAVLSTIVLVSYQNTSRYVRDTRRKRDLANIQVALESYKQTTGAYPVSTGCGGTWTWPGCDGWMANLVPDYLPTAPEDPRNNYTGAIYNSGYSLSQLTYNYTRLSATTYILLTRMENEGDVAINGSQFISKGVTGEGLYVVSEPK